MSLLAQPPPIAPLADNAERPLLSVMIPTFNRIDHLARTLESILIQKGMVGKTEIVVVDNCSDKADPRRLIESMGGGGIQFHRNPRNLGAGGNFNRCIELARGEWVHILHSDDFIYEDFHADFESIVKANPDAEAIGFRSRMVDDNEAFICDTPDLSGDSMSVAREAFLDSCPVQCSGVVVKRSAWERLGGFTSAFRHVGDVEAWTRIFFNSRTIFSPNVRAAYRVHQASASADQWKDNECDELYRLTPYLKKNMTLSDQEVRRYTRRCHYRANNYCFAFAKARKDSEWKKAQILYLRHLGNVQDAAKFLLRLKRNIVWRLTKSDPNNPVRPSF